MRSCFFIIISFFLVQCKDSSKSTIQKADKDLQFELIRKNQLPLNKEAIDALTALSYILDGEDYARSNAYERTAGMMTGIYFDLTPDNKYLYFQTKVVTHETREPYRIVEARIPIEEIDLRYLNFEELTLFENTSGAFIRTRFNNKSIKICDTHRNIDDGTSMVKCSDESYFDFTIKTKHAQKFKDNLIKLVENF